MQTSDVWAWAGVLGTWSGRRGTLTVACVALAVAAAGAASVTLGTPQLSGAQAPVTLGAVSGAVAGFALGYLARPSEEHLERRAARPLGGLRVAGGLALLVTVSGLVCAVGPAGADWSAYRNAMVAASAGLLLVRYLGSTASALAFSGYLGACLLLGVPGTGAPRWWAVLLHEVHGPSVAVVVATGVAVLCTWVTMRTPAVRARRRP